MAKKRQKKKVAAKTEAPSKNSNVAISFENNLPVVPQDHDDEKKLRKFSNAKDELEEMYISMINVLNTVKSHDDSGPFLNPVEEDLAPGYFNLIKEPMDISTIEVKVLQRVYKSRKQFEKDFRKMVTNCEVFNGVGNAYTNMANNIWRVFTKSMKKHFAKRTKFKSLRDSPPPESLACQNSKTSEPLKLYVCSRKTVDGAIKITIKQTEPKVVPPTKLQSVKVGGKPSFEVKKENAPINICSKKSQINQNNNIDQPTLRKAVAFHQKPTPIARLPASRRRKKKKIPVGMKALEALAEAAERALKDAASRSSFDDDAFSSHSNSPIYNSSAFPNLKISTTQSHPADLIHRLSSKTSSGSSTPEKFVTESKITSNGNENKNVDDSRKFSESKNDIIDIFPCAAATLVFPRSLGANVNPLPKTGSPDSGVFDLSPPIVNNKRQYTTRFSDSEDSSAFESDCSEDEFESASDNPKFPEIKPCQVTLSRLSPRLYYKGNKVRILEQVKMEKKRKRRRSRRRSLQSNNVTCITRELRSNSFNEGTVSTEIRVKEEQDFNLLASFDLRPIKEHSLISERKPSFSNEVTDETNFQQQWGKNNVPPRKRYSSLIPNDVEIKMFCDNKVRENNLNNTKITETIDDKIVHLDNFATFESNPLKEEPQLDPQFDSEASEAFIDVENVKEEETSPPCSLNTFQFESITDSESDEGYTTNERTTPVFKSNDKWYFNSLTSRFMTGEAFSSQYPRANDSNLELQFGMTPYGNSDLPNEKNGFSFEAQCRRDENYFQPIKPSYIDFSMLTPLSLEMPSPKTRPTNNAGSFFMDSFPNSDSGLIKTSSSILRSPYRYESIFQHSSQ